MSFSFGAKPAATGFGFGAAAAAPVASTPAFGGFGTNTQTNTGSAFGGFGAKPAAQPTSFGGFGAAPAATQASAFGGFGAPAATSQPSTGFTGFGATAATQASAFGGFGAPTAASQPSTGFSGFGTNTTQTSTGFGGFGAATAKPTGFGAATTGFGAPAATSTGFGGFGATTATQPSTGFGGFGTAAAAKPTGFGFGASTTTGFGGATTGFGVQQQQQQQQAAVNPVDELFNSVLNCSLFGDERDGIIAKWNMLQASWGKGKAYYSNNSQPVTILPENPFCRFKAIGYSALPKHDDKEGLVSLMFKKKEAEIEAGKAQLVSGISALLGNKPNIKVSVQNIKATSGDTSEVVLTVEETSQTGAVRKVPATEMHTFFNQPTQAGQLKNFGVEMVVPKVAITESDLKEYLTNPPAGIDPRLWKQAQLDNPDPKAFIPVPIIGFKALQQRIKTQETQSKAHQGRLDCIAEDISQLQKKHQNTLAALAQAQRRQLELSHRVLKVLVKQESTRKNGFTITQEEEQLRSQLESIQAEIETPTQFKGRLNEVLSQVRLQSQSVSLAGTEKYTLDQYAVADIKSVLKEQQQAIQALVSLVKDDTADLNLITDGLSNIET